MSDESLIKKRIRLVQKAFGTALLDRDGVNVAVCCVNKNCSTYGKPAKKKLTLRVDNEFFHCWVCGLRGKGLAYFFKRYKHNHYNIAASIFEKKVEEKAEEILPELELPNNFKMLATIRKDDDPDLRQCRAYMINRGFTQNDLWYYRVGAVSSGRYRRRVIIPSFDDEGSLNYFTGRSIDPDVTRKYMNPKVKRTEVIFNELNIDWSLPLVLVEGPFDMMKSVQNSTCLLGSSLSENHALFRKIVSNRVPVVLALDPDAKQKMQDIARLLSSYDIEVKCADITPYEDVGAMPMGEMENRIKESKVWSNMDRLKTLISSIKSGSLV